MELVSYSDSWLSLLPPAIAIILAVVTRKVLWSLGAGVVTGAFLLSGYQPLGTLEIVADRAIGVFYEDGWSLNSIYILLFLFALGILTSIISTSGGARAFGEWARKRVKTRQGSQLLTVVLGFLIFIDDYFNSLAVGSISRPLTDRHRVSRAKLAYLVDSTAAPICILMPISSWGAYIIAVIGGIMASHGLTDINPITAFITMIPMNLYAVFALLMVIFTAWLDLNVGAMGREERSAMEGHLFDPHKGHPPGAPELDEDPNGRVSDLVAPIIMLIIATVGSMLYTGYDALQAQGKAFSVLGAFENTAVSLSLISGGTIGLVFSIVRMLSRGFSLKLWNDIIIEGLRAMLPAIYILVFAWMLTAIIGMMETGTFLASQVGSNIDAAFLPLMMFLISGVMAFATGTSWGTFGIMLPIAGDMAAALEISMMFPMMGAVLAGAVFGDHCSPISDTTILSSTGASCHHIDHVTTQLPYALSIAFVSILGYVVLGLTGSMVIGFALSAAAFLTLVLIFRRLSVVPTLP